MNISNVVDKVKGYILSVPAKYRKIGIAALAVILVLAVLLCAGGGKVKGSYLDEDGWRYEFLAGSTRVGEYGGTVNVYNGHGELSKTHTWYVEDDQVYFDGKLRYHFDGEYLYTGLMEGVTVDGDRLLGSSEGFKHGYEGSVMFLPIEEAKNEVGYYADSFVGVIARVGTYTIEDGFVNIISEYGHVEFTYIIREDGLYETVLYPI